MTLIDRLRHLQDLDQEWDDKARRYQETRNRLADQSEFEERQNAQQDLSEQLRLRRAHLRDMELELAGIQSKGEQVEMDLYSGRITAPRELDSLRKDSEYLKRRVSELEDQALELMTEVDDLETAASEGQASLESFSADWARTREALASEYRELHARLQKLKSEREVARGDLDRATLALYEELRRLKNGAVLSPAVDGVCQTCRVSQPSQKAEQIQSGERVVTCFGCDRILYPG